jgi:hypothetical protein
MIYYECYHISKSYNFNTKLNYIFNNMEHQALVTLVMAHGTTIAPRYVAKYIHSIMYQGLCKHFLISTIPNFGKSQIKIVKH